MAFNWVEGFLVLGNGFIGTAKIGKIISIAKRTWGGRSVTAVVKLAVAGIVMAASPVAWAAFITVHAFGQDISVPQHLPSGSVISRYYITPMQACGKATCTFRGINNYPAGSGSTGAGPIISTTVTGVSAQLLINGKGYKTGNYLSEQFSSSIEVQLLSNGQSIQSGSFGGTWYFTVFTTEVPDGARIFLSPNGKVTAIVGTCSAPNQTVTLPSARPSQFSGIGSTAGAKSFQLRVDNCPRGYNRIGYLLNPVGGAIVGSPGVLPLGAGSSAKGVRIRVEDDKGVAATFDTSIRVDAYDKATGGSYAIPMQASYIQTAAAITPGTVSGAMTVLLDYQ
ncbi:fimbrial protein [Burkholderia cepacia]|uniref:Type 1 fimbrial protein n=1 Tax=Burkholderia cepacia TaxID=292 RepID=A0AAQ0JM32_BURCE|nr:fimbrial protein [Burkholderia cepacia]MDN7860064.1 fimbrial protein [Burkholderia cepacia]QFS38717.1 Fimbrial protein [Burkholderia cepacia]RAQ12992.1 type 1 fimbrial protein [Burkholderia cepacia]